jgi:malate synthase
MEDAATAEISRAQVWQWVHHGAKINGQPLSRETVRQVIANQKDKLKGRRMTEAAEIFDRLITSSEFAEFLTLEAYDYIE